MSILCLLESKVMVFPFLPSGYFGHHSCTETYASISAMPSQQIPFQ